MEDGKVLTLAVAPLCVRRTWHCDRLAAAQDAPTASAAARILYQDESCVVIVDGFPKARVHLLLMPRAEFLNCRHGVTDLR
jgi:hypothetical protein